MRRREGWRDKSCDETRSELSRATVLCGRDVILGTGRLRGQNTRESKEMRRRNYSCSSIRAISGEVEVEMACMDADVDYDDV